MFSSIRTRILAACVAIVVFALVARQARFLKADDINKPNFLNRGLKAFQPFDGPGTMSYYEAPPEIFEDPDAVRQWCGSAVEAGRRSLSRKPKSQKPKR